MSGKQIDCDSVAEIYDLYVAADYDIPFFLHETANVEGPVLELTAGTGRLSLVLIQVGVQLTCVDGSQASGPLSTRVMELLRQAMWMPSTLHCRSTIRLRKSNGRIRKRVGSTGSRSPLQRGRALDCLCSAAVIGAIGHDRPLT